RPVYVPYDQWRKSHVQVIGTTGAGKGVASAVLLSQAQEKPLTPARVLLQVTPWVVVLTGFRQVRPDLAHIG
ncbi:hypothetical protein, partial [Aeromonas caviae]|uniref:hypothetical protein n=1 Tax=Aeromonas caviae TaxID=648 RepID=UPI001CC810B1